MDGLFERVIAIIAGAALLVGTAMAIKGIRELWMWCMA